MSFTAVVKLSDKSFRIGLLKRGLTGKRIILEEEILPQEGGQVPERLTATLEDLKKEYPLRECYLSIPFQSVTTFFLDLPLRKRQEIARAIEFELENRLPLPLSEYSLAFDVLARRGRTSRVVVMAVLKRDLERYTRICSGLGIRIKGIRVDFLEMLNGVIKKGLLNKGRSLFIYRGEGSYSAALVEKGDILSLKHFRDLRFLMNYLVGITKENRPSCYYSGSGEPPEELMPCEQVDYDFRAFLSEMVSSRKPLRIDFIGSPEVHYQHRYAVALSSLAALSFILYVLSILIPYWFDYRELKRLQRGIQSIESEASDVLNMNSRLDAVDSRLREMVLLKKRRYEAIDALAELGRVLPGHSWVVMFKYNGKTVEISGFSKRAIEVLKALEASKRFSNVRFSSPIITMKDRERFVIRMEMEQ